MLKSTDREKVQDCLLLVQSARNILLGIRPGVVPDADALARCFQDADQTLRRLLSCS